MSATTARRLTVDSVAPVIDGVTHTAPQPLGTWMSRWAFVYGSADIAHPLEAPGTTMHVRPLPAGRTAA